MYQGGGLSVCQTDSRADEYFAPIHERLDELLDPAGFIGRAPQQVDRFVKEEARPALSRYAKVLAGQAELAV